MDDTVILVTRGGGLGTTEKVVQALLLGNHRQDAAVYAGIGAEARAKITAIGCITKAARSGDWRAARRAPVLFW